MKILVVDDEQDILDFVSLSLERERYEVISTPTGEGALKLVEEKRPDLVILDLMLPGIQGLEVCRQIRSVSDYARIPILMLSARDGEIDKVLGLEMGADDYMTKPFSVRELVARVRAILRRSEDYGTRTAGERTCFSHKDLFIDFDKYEVLIDGRKIELPRMQMELLFFLTRHPGRVYTRDQLVDLVWGEGVSVTRRTVDVHVSRLRSFIEKDAQKPAYIVTVTGVGYKFDDSSR